MFTDIVGYTALSQSDERTAMKLLQKHNEILRPVFAKFNGREVKSIGDSFLVEFESAFEATECAVEAQKAMVEYNTKESSHKPVHIRIGIHVGDVIHQSGDVFGDAVNLASRVQPLADPDGICISEQVYAQVRNKLPLEYVLLPPKNLKNVQFAMNIYKIVAPSSREETMEKASFPRTRIAVLPFTNISQDSKDEYFADGVTEELITAISRIHDLKVIARTSTARYKGTSKSVAEIGRELSVGSVLEGSTRIAGSKVRVTAQLIDSASEEHVWSNNYDRQLDDIFSIQSEIARSVSEALEIQLLSKEEKRLAMRATQSSSAFVKYLKGRASLHNRKEQDLLDAKKFFQEAIAEDENFAMAYVGLADAYFLLGEYYSMPRDEAQRNSRTVLSKALSFDGNLTEGRVALANSLQHDYKFAEAVTEYDRALSINPNYAQGHHWYAICLWDMGRYDEAMTEMLKAEELDPLSVVIAFNVAFGFARQGDRDSAMERVRKIRELDPSGYYEDETMSFILELDSDFKSCCEYLERVTQKDPRDLTSLARLGKCYGLSGQRDKARSVLARLEKAGEGRLNSWQLAVVHGGLGEKDEMFLLFDKAFAERSLLYRALWIDAAHFGVQKDHRYLALLAKAGLA